MGLEPTTLCSLGMSAQPKNNSTKNEHYSNMYVSYLMKEGIVLLNETRKLGVLKQE